MPCTAFMPLEAGINTAKQISLAVYCLVNIAESVSLLFDVAEFKGSPVHDS